MHAAWVSMPTSLGVSTLPAARPCKTAWRVCFIVLTRATIALCGQRSCEFWLRPGGAGPPSQHLGQLASHACFCVVHIPRSDECFVANAAVRYGCVLVTLDLQHSILDSPIGPHLGAHLVEAAQVWLESTQLAAELSPGSAVSLQVRHATP
eukprot:1161279-Pelagomonas_calceolata.AAC.4